MIICGIDPGKKGGFAWGTGKLGEVIVSKMPETDRDILDLIRNDIRPDRIVMEKVGGFIGVASPGSAMFNFGENFGLVRGICLTLDVPLELVTPQSWQKKMALGTKNGSSKTDWKNKLKAVAQRLYPSTKITLDTSDAVLIYHSSLNA